jgi:hypothetical protein
LRHVAVKQRKRVDRARLALRRAAANLEVQMRRGARAGRSDEADDLAAADLRARFAGRRYGAEVRVARREMWSVLEADEVAVAAGLSGRLEQRHRSGVGGVDRRARRREEVDAVVCPGRGQPKYPQPPTMPSTGLASSPRPGSGRVPSSFHARARSTTIALDSSPPASVP